MTLAPNPCPPPDWPCPLQGMEGLEYMKAPKALIAKIAAQRARADAARNHTGAPPTPPGHLTESALLELLLLHANDSAAWPSASLAEKFGVPERDVQAVIRCRVCV